MNDRSALRLAYLTGEYPKASHTFIQREVAWLRALGAEVTTASVRRPPRTELIGAEEEAEFARTFYVLAAAKNPARLLAAHGALLRTPGRWFSALKLAYRTARPGAKGLLWQLFYFLEAGVLAHHLKGQGATHLHNHFADSSATVAMLAAHMARIPYSFTLHGPAEFFAPETWALGEKIARADFVATISHFARSQAMIFSDPAHWDKLRIVHCGIDPARYDARPRQGDGLKLIFVGRLTALKGLRVLFQAFEAVRKSRPDITLTVIGDGPDRAHLDAEAARIGGIEMLGYRSQSEVAEALARADALILPSFAEGVPVVLMEAMASARPVIATRVGGVGELVEDGVSGHVIAPGDPDALADAIAALTDPAARTAMGAAGRAKVTTEYDGAAEAARLLALFEGRGGDGPRPAR